MSFLSRLYYFYLAQEFRYQFVILLVVVLLALSLLLLFVVLRERSRKNRQESRIKRFNAAAKPHIQTIAFTAREDKTHSEALKELKKLLDREGEERESSKKLAYLLLYFHQNLGGEAAQRLEEAYRELGLKAAALKAMKEGPWHIQARAIAELGRMSMGEVLFEVLQFTDHENEQVRNEAQTCSVKLGGRKALRFLDDLQSPLSEWQQMRLLEHARHFQHQELDQLSRWLKSKNADVLLFALRLVQHLNQFQCRDLVVKALYHKDPRIQLKAIDVCVSLSIHSATKELKEVYDLTRDLRTKKKIIAALGSLGGLPEALHMRELIRKEKEHGLVLAAATGLKQQGQSQWLAQWSREADQEQQAILKHALDERI